MQSYQDDLDYWMIDADGNTVYRFGITLQGKGIAPTDDSAGQH